MCCAFAGCPTSMGTEPAFAFPHRGHRARKRTGEMVSTLEGKRVVVISDNDLLFRAIEQNLHGRLRMEVLRSVADTPTQVQAQANRDGWDLIVVALSEPVGEPVVELVQASLTRWLGRVPLLIISERPFEARPEQKIVHLSFPFAPDELFDTVAWMLTGIRGASKIGGII